MFLSNRTKAVVAVVLLLLLTVGIGAGVYFGVKRQQDIRSKAAGECPNMRWPARPDSACAQSTLVPGQNATGVSLTPNFHWDYGGDRPGENGQCVQPSGCATYGGTLYLVEGDYSDAAIIASCALTVSSAPVKDALFSCLRVWRDGPALGPLKPNTKYTWRVTPSYNDIVHYELTNYTFTTTSGPPSVFICGPMTLTPSSTTISSSGETRALTVTASGAVGALQYSWTATGGTLSSTTGPTATWTAPALGTTAQTWEIKATLWDSRGPAYPGTAGTCTRTLTYAPAPAAACQRVLADKDLTAIKIGDTVKFTGFGILTNPAAGDAIDKIKFILTRDGTPVSSTDVNTLVDSVSGSTTAWVATQSATISDSGSYSMQIKVHRASNDTWLE